MGTSTFEKGGWLIAITGITQTIAVTVNIVTNWTVIVVMLIIITLKMVLSLLIVVGWARLYLLVFESEELDKHNMVLPSLWGTMCTVEQWWQKAYTLNTQFEHQLLCPLLRSILNMYLHTSQKCWEWRSDDLDNKQDVREAIAIKWMNHYKWPTTYYSRHYCINAIKQYRCVAKI